MSDAQATRRSELPGRYDRGLLLAALGLAGLGLVMVASSSIPVADNQHVGPFYYVTRHLIFLALGLGLAITAMRIELEKVEQHSGVVLLAGFALLLSVFVPGIGMRINGALRWIHLGVSGFQPVEAFKLLLILYLSSYLVRHRESVQRNFFGVIKPIGVAGIGVALLLVQPDFGSAALIGATTVGLIWLGGARLRNLVFLGLPIMPVMAYAAMFAEYRLKRLTSFRDPFLDPFGDGYQLAQALIAVGRGEWLGVGLGGSVQKLFYLPEAHTDFILAVIAEELGLAGIVLVLALFAALCGRGLMIGARAIQRGLYFQGYVAFGVSLCIALQALVSIGVNLGVLPTKGLTLPLISSGGSSVMMTCAMIGVLLRVSYELAREEAQSAETAQARVQAGVWA
ncbi:putative lipid II flippase FtsW [Tahibacter sp. UC22_41]|uniref:putative lipid II flippase FtsW n=1 Tax=Tahibacter sp. UC22_41 TaxID=3350178 RepID=UPI0036D8EAFA